ncbi:MAG: tetratricopeptide repeat protein, partial [Fibrella sp.]|nr:tetratricopeptide repeat protein [Armatimonadota bacterium]
CAAFAAGPAALAAATAAHVSLGREPWADPISIRARIALHSGATQERDGDYFGSVLSRVARLLSAAHGGQTLVSAAAYELARDHLPDGGLMRDLGTCRLKDLERPERVYQLVYPELPDDFPPLRSLDDVPNNLPQYLTGFVGREREMGDIKSLLQKTRLVTLTGTGGMGKTRLSQQIAADILDEYPDGVWRVELAPLTSGTQVPQAVAQALGVNEQPGQGVPETLIANLKDKQLLLLLDNCEHLVAGCAELAAALLRSCPQTCVLATSREPLNIAGEQVYRVPSLSLPDPKQGGSTIVQSLRQYEAVRLFIERTLLVKPAFAVTDANAPALAQVCHRLDGIPLALELASARMRSLSVEEINDRLDNRFRLLTGGDRTATPRQQTLRGLVDWSYELLSGQEKTLLARLSVFAGGWTLSAAEAACGFDPVEEWEVLDLLTSLADKSLVLAEEEGGATRYRMLETLRQYAAEKCDLSAENATLRSRHRDWFLALAEEGEMRLKGPDQAAWLTRLETEHDNLRAALEWCATYTEGEAGLRLAGALWRFWQIRGHFTEGREHLMRALGQTNSRTAASAKAHSGAGNLARFQGDTATARSLNEQSLAISRESGDALGIAYALDYLGGIARSEGDHVSARTMYEEGLAISRGLGNKYLTASLLYNLGYVFSLLGDHVSARTLYEESLAIRRELGDKYGIAYSLNNLGILAHDQGDTVSAGALYEESLAIQRGLGDQRGIAMSLNNLGNVARLQGDPGRARSFQEESLTIRRKLGDRQGIAATLLNLGSLAHYQGDEVSSRSFNEEVLAISREVGDRQLTAMSLLNLGNLICDAGDHASARALHRESLAIFRGMGNGYYISCSLEALADVFVGESQTREAVVLWGAANALRERSGSPLLQDEQAKHRQELERARSVLGDAGLFAAAWEEGRGLTTEQAVEYALGEVSGS